MYKNSDKISRLRKQGLVWVIITKADFFGLYLFSKLCFLLLTLFINYINTANLSTIWLEDLSLKNSELVLRSAINIL